MNILQFPIIKITIWLILGSIAGHYYTTNPNIILIFCSVLLLLLGILLLLTKNRVSNFWWLDVFAGTVIFAFGILSVNFHEHKNFNEHYTNTISIENDSVYHIKFRIHQVLKPSLYHHKYMVDLLSIDDNSICGRSLLNVSKDTIVINLEVDHIYFTKSSLHQVKKPLNPFQFDYSQYLRKRYVNHQLYLDPNELFLVDSSKRTLFGYASVFRKNVNRSLAKHNLKPEVKSVINALLLGQRQDISEELYDSYAQAGAVHILAISGLHIGIILLLLNSLFKPLEWLKQGRLMKILLIIGLLWSYALIAGLSASVVRASMMFTVFAIGMNLKRPANTYNTLAISMFILLLLKPNFLLDVGFQLSYLAVLSIITIVPMLTTWWSPKNKLLNFFWRILAVTISAQIGVLPLSLYYFHQFPGLFFVSNLVIIPLLGFILCFGLLVVLLASLNCLPEFLISIYAVIIDVMNAFVQLVSAQETFLFQNIPFDLGHVILSYLLIGATILYFKNRRFKHLLSVLVMIISFQTFIIYKKYTSAGFEFILFHKSRHTIIGERYGNTMTIYHNLNEPLKNQNIIINYKVGQAIKEVHSDSLKNVFDISGKKLLLIDSLGVYTTTFKPEFVLLTNSPKINLVRLIDSLQPELILSDGSNYRTYQERWKLTCEAKKIPFHQTGEKGAFIISY